MSKGKKLEKIKFSLLTIIITFFLFSIAAPKKMITIEDASEINQENKVNEISYNKVYNKMIKPVVILYTVSSGEINGSGTAFGISYDKKNNQTYFLTNAHICNAEDRNTMFIGTKAKNDTAIFTFSGDYDMIFEIVDISTTDDLCLLKTKGKFETVKLKRQNKINQGERIYIVGSPNSTFPIVLDSYYSGKVPKETLASVNGEGHVVLVSEMLHPGHSGSPVYNKKGELIGIVFGASIRSLLGPDLALHSYGSLAVSLEDIELFLEKNSAI